MGAEGNAARSAESHEGNSGLAACDATLIVISYQFHSPFSSLPSPLLLSMLNLPIKIRILTVTIFVFTCAMSQAQQDVHTPPAGSAERQAIMDVMRLDFYPGDAEAAHRNPKGVLFKVSFLMVHGDWACAHVDPVDGAGKRIAEPRWALLQRKDGRWTDAHYFDALRPFETDAAAENALDMNAATIRKVRAVFPDAPADIFPGNERLMKRRDALPRVLYSPARVSQP
jgi:hypothetical protein